jgi:hypothetical protein
MTDDRMALAQLLEKGSDSDLLREMIGYVAQRLMQLDVEGLVGAAPVSVARAARIGATATGIARLCSSSCAKRWSRSDGYAAFRSWSLRSSHSTSMLM